MATFFGEIRPVVSRAVDDDDDDDDEVVNNKEKFGEVVLRWEACATEKITANGQNHLKSHLLILGIGKISCGFLQAYVLSVNKQLLGTVSCHKQTTNEDGIWSVRPNNNDVHLYSNHKNQCDVIVGLCMKSIEPEMAFSVVQQIFSNLDTCSLNVVVLNNSHVSEFRTANSFDEQKLPLLRMLQTDSFKEEIPFLHLEQPNTVAGFPAAVLTYCQVHSIPAVLYHCYTDVLDVDSVNVKAFQAVLSHKPFTDFVQINCDGDKKIKDLVSYSMDCGNLYI